MTEPLFTLADGERVVAAWAEVCRDPGWANWPIVVLVAARSGTLRMEYIQPEAQGNILPALHATSAAMSETMVREVARLLRERGGTP